MMRRTVLALTLGAAALAAQAAPRQSGAHRFAVIGNSFAGSGGEERLERGLAHTRDSSLAFVVSTGIKGGHEPCSDTLYARRRELFDDVRRPVIVVPAASDWTECVNGAGRQAPIERLNRLRELFYAEPVSLGARPLPLVRLSTTAKFRSYAENAHWVVGKVMYATVNLPANNNHYLIEAGRNSEFEDRSVANRFWLKRVFTMARRSRAEAVVLFSEGDVKVLSEKPGLLERWRRPAATSQDGFAETRRQIKTLAQKFTGKVLLVDTAPLPAGTDPALVWHGNLGHVSVGSDTVAIDVNPATPALFSLRRERAEKQETPEK